MSFLGPEGLVGSSAFRLCPAQNPKILFGARLSGSALSGTRRSRSGHGLLASSFPGPEGLVRGSAFWLRPSRDQGLVRGSAFRLRPSRDQGLVGSSAFRLRPTQNPKILFGARLSGSAPSRTKTSFGARPSGSVLPGTKASSGTRPSGFVPPRVRRSCLGFGLPALLPPRPEGLVRGSAMSLVCLGTPSEQGWNSLSGLSSLLVGLPLLRDESRRFEVAFEQSRQSSTVPDEAFLRAEALGIAYIWHLQVGLGRPIVLEPTSDSWSTKRPPPWSLSSCSGHAETCRNRPRWRCPFRGLHHPDNCVAPGALSLAASRSRRIDELCHPSPRPRPCSDPLSSPDCRKNRRLESDIGSLPGSIHLRLQRGPKTSPETGRPRARNFSPLGEIDSINVSISLFEKNVPNRRGPGSAPRFSTP
jgi:hypothetical protein